MKVEDWRRFKADAMSNHTPEPHLTFKVHTSTGTQVKGEKPQRCSQAEQSLSDPALPANEPGVYVLLGRMLCGMLCSSHFLIQLICHVTDSPSIEANGEMSMLILSALGGARLCLSAFLTCLI